MELCKSDFSRTSFWFVLIAHLYIGRNTTSVINDGDGLIAIDGDVNVISITRQGFIDRIIDDLKDKVMKSCSVRRIADVHAGTLADMLQTFENLGNPVVLLAQKEISEKWSSGYKNAEATLKAIGML